MLATNTSHPAGNGFVFFDIETTGLSKYWSQITQIAAIRTDPDFNIVDAKRDILDLRGRRLPWIVPSPGAMLVTGVTPDQLERTLLSHYEMMREVAATFEDWGPATFIGYNSIAFDEEHIRNALFSTLHPPYLTSQPGCGRADSYTMLKVISALTPGVIHLPEINGKPSMKLGPVLRANGIPFAEADAHDALADVKGTIALMRLMHERCPTIANHMLRMASRRAAQACFDENVIFRHVTYYGTPHVALSKRVAAHPSNPNCIAIFDLAHDPAPYLNLDVEQLKVALRATPRVLRTIKLNAQPSVLPRDIVPPATDELDDFTLEARAVSLALATQFKRNVAEAMKRLSEDYPKSPFVEERLYDGFPTWAERNLAARFHLTSDWRERYRMIGAFDDARLGSHALRLIYAECPNALPGPVLDAMHDWCRDRLLSLDDDLPYLTIHAACEELQALKEQDAETGGHPVPVDGGKTNAERIDEIEHYYLMLASGHQ